MTENIHFPHPHSDIPQYRKKLINSLMMDTIGHPYGTVVDCLVAEFSKKDDISYLFVTHDLQSGFVTHKKEKNDNPIVEHEESQYISVYRDEIAAWCKTLKLGDN